jgi:hypothetical protein
MSIYDPEKAIEAGGTALRPGNSYPWYDPASDGLARVAVRPREAPAESEAAGPLLNYLIYGISLSILTIIIVGLIFMILRARRLRKAANNPSPLPVVGEAERIEALPFPVPRGKLSLLDQARAFYEAGNYASATIYLFSHQLVQLDRGQIIRLAKGKTNRQYLREVGQAETLRRLVGQTLVAFEDVFFGHHTIDRSRFEACWSRLPEFDLLVAKGKPSAALGVHVSNASLVSFIALIALAWGSGSGCHKELQTVYGERIGPGATESVNGTAVFAAMFEQAGHHVSSWGSLSPRLDQADCVVWFPNDFEPPSPAVVNWFDAWLSARPHRTLIYVGRDFDAEPWYWGKVEPTAPAGEQDAISQARDDAEKNFQAARPKNTSMSCRWFTIDYRAPAGRATHLDGDMEWTTPIDPSKLEIVCNSRMSPQSEMDTVLECDQGMIIGRLDRRRGQLFAVANGSFLLNAMLVNHEHRKLAGKLIDEIGPAGKEVVFLESGQLKVDQPKASDPAPTSGPDPFQTGPGDNGTSRPQASDNGPPIRRTDPEPGTPNGLELLLVWPTNWILLHVAFIGILFCLWKLPIFGLPRPPDPIGASDFGRHVDAVAALLERTADREFAKSRIKHYQQIVK